MVTCFSGELIMILCLALEWHISVARMVMYIDSAGGHANIQVICLTTELCIACLCVYNQIIKKWQRYALIQFMIRQKN